MKYIGIDIGETSKAIQMNIQTGQPRATKGITPRRFADPLETSIKDIFIKTLLEEMTPFVNDADGFKTSKAREQLMMYCRKVYPSAVPESVVDYVFRKMQK